MYFGAPFWGIRTLLFLFGLQFHLVPVNSSSRRVWVSHKICPFRKYFHHSLLEGKGRLEGSSGKGVLEECGAESPPFCPCSGAPLGPWGAAWGGSDWNRTHPSRSPCHVEVHAQWGQGRPDLRASVETLLSWLSTHRAQAGWSVHTPCLVIDWSRRGGAFTLWLVLVSKGSRRVQRFRSAKATRLTCSLGPRSPRWRRGPAWTSPRPGSRNGCQN